MHCDEVRTILLDYGWDADERRRATLMLRHLEGCDACRAAVADYDSLRAALCQVATGGGTLAGATAGEPTGTADEPPRGWDDFLKRIEPADADQQRLRLRPRPPGGRAAAALAACVLLSVAAFQLGRQTNAVRGVAALPEASGRAGSPVSTQIAGEAGGRSDDVLLASLTPSADDAARQATAFEQVSDVFDRKASWLMTSAGGTSDVGLARDTLPAGRKLLMLRLAVLHGGVVASNADVVIVPGQSADLSLPMSDGRSLKYHIDTSDGDPTELTLWLEVQDGRGGRAGAQRLAALSTNLRVRPGERVAAGELATTAGKYELKVGFTQTEASELPAAGAPPDRKGGGAP